MTTINFNLLSFRYYIIREYAIIIQNNIIGFYDWRFLQFVKRKSLFRTRKLITSSCITLSIGILLGSDPAPPYTDYCKMLEKNIAGIQHGFLAGNKMYYVGGQTGAFWDGIMEEETIGFTHPFFRDMRSRGFGITKDDYGSGHDKWGWEFYRMSRAAYGTVIANGKRYVHPKPSSIIWRPDRQLTFYELDDIKITEIKFITEEDVVCAIIKSSKPVKIKFEGSSYYNNRDIPTFDGDTKGIPWQQNPQSKISFDKVNNSIRIDESGDMMVKPNWGEKAVLGKMMYEGMSVLISSSESIHNTYNFSTNNKNIALYDFTISCDTSGIVLFYGIGDSYNELLRNVNNVKIDANNALQEKTKAINELLNYQIPFFRCSDTTVVETYYYLWAIYFMYFLDVGEGYIQYPHTQTAINNFMGLHLWDSSVYTRMGSWVVDKWKYGFGNMLNWKNMLPFRKKGGRLPDNFGIDWYSPVWFTPVYTIPGAWMLYQHSGDKEYLQEVYSFLDTLYENGIQAGPPFVLMASSYLKKMAAELEQYNAVHSWQEKYDNALENFYTPWESQTEHYYGSYNHLGKDIWHLAAVMADEFPDAWVKQLTETWIMDTEKGFLGPVALDVRSKKSKQNGIFEVSTISTWQVIEGLFQNNVDKEAVFITLHHINGMNRDYGFPVAPEVWTPDYKPWGSMYYNWDGAMVLPIIKRLSGFDYSVEDRSISISDHAPPKWDFIHLMVPIDQKSKQPKWVDLYIERKKNNIKNLDGSDQIIKQYTVLNAGSWDVEITPWLEDRNILDSQTSSNGLRKNKIGEPIYLFPESGHHTLELTLGSDNNPLEPRVLVTPEARQFIDKQTVTIKNMMPDGKVYYQTPGSQKFRAYTVPVEINNSGILKVQVKQKNNISSVYEFDFKKEKPIKSVKKKNKTPGLHYKYFEGSWAKLPDFKTKTPAKENNCDNISVDLGSRDEHFGLAFSGYIDIPENGIYTFYLRSNDGSRLMIQNKILSIIDGIAALDPIYAAPARVALEKGLHPIAVDYFQSITRKALFVEIAGPNMMQQIIPAEMFFRDN